MDKEKPKIKILLVEDTLGIREVMVGLLKTMNCSIAIAKNGEQAVEIFEKKTFDLVLMDIMMPKMDGYEAAKCMRKIQLKSELTTKIIALTSKNDPEDLEKSLASGMDGHIVKPFEFEEIIELIEGLRGGTKRSCENCAMFDDCSYDHSPGKKFICWKVIPKIKT